MNLVFDSRWVGDHGIGRFALEVCHRLESAELYECHLKPTEPLDVFYLSYNFLKRNCSLWFSPGYNAPLWGLDRYVFTIHDLNHIDLDTNSSPLKRLYYSLVMRRACRRAARVLTVSEFSRQRIIDWAGVPPSGVVNVGNGVSSAFSCVVEPYQPGYPYLFCVGNRKGHKNELRLLQAFASASIDSSIRLVFSGPSSAELEEAARGLGVVERLSFLGRVEEGFLSSVYRGAIALVFPSLYEGFGLPVIESMACGTPVITSNTTALPEVAGDAALLVDPTDVAAITGAIEAIVGDETLRARLSAKGLERAKAFSWDLVADRVKAVLSEVATERIASR